MWVALAVICLIFILLPRREGFKFEMKAETGSLGLHRLPLLATAAAKSARYARESVVNVIPFRGHLRAMHRNLRRKF